MQSNYCIIDGCHNPAIPYHLCQSCATGKVLSNPRPAAPAARPVSRPCAYCGQQFNAPDLSYQYCGTVCATYGQDGLRPASRSEARRFDRARLREANK